MTDLNIYTTIFNNRYAMEYLIGHNQLINDIKQLNNYSSILVQYLLNSNIYTDEQKYNYHLPFYLYNNGIYSSNLFIPTASATTVYLTSPTVAFKSINNYLLFSSTNQYPNGCSTVKGYSEKNINYANYSKSKIDVSYINTTFPSNLFLGYRYPYFKDNIITQVGTFSSDISSQTDNTSLYVDFSSCDNSFDSNGNYAKHNMEMHIDRWWIE